MVNDESLVVQNWIAHGDKVAALVAPSFVADFNPPLAPGLFRKLGFSKVYEVAYGAEICTLEYKKLFKEDLHQTLISTPCPAIVQLVEKHFTGLIEYLAPIDSPMIIQAKIVKEALPHYKTVFIGPCIAKKHEAKNGEQKNIVDAVITFKQIKKWIEALDLDVSTVEKVSWDSPGAGLARSFPISGGLLKTAGIAENVAAMDVVITEGAKKCIEVLKAIETGDFAPKFVDMLACEGCITGPEMISNAPYVTKAGLVAKYIQSNSDHHIQLKEFSSNINFRRTFTAKPIKRKKYTDAQIWEVLKSTGKYSEDDLINCGACGYDTCWEKAVACFEGMAENEMCLPYLLMQVPSIKQNLEKISNELMASIESVHFAMLTIKTTSKQISEKDKLLQELVDDLKDIFTAIPNIKSEEISEDLIKQLNAVETKENLNKITKILSEIRKENMVVMEQEQAITKVASSLEQIVATYQQLVTLGSALANISRNYS